MCLTCPSPAILLYILLQGAQVCFQQLFLARTRETVQDLVHNTDEAQSKHLYHTSKQMATGYSPVSSLLLVCSTYVSHEV